MKVTVVDLGTNTCRLLLADVQGGCVETVARITTVVRLGQGVDARGRLHPDAVRRARECLAGYAERCEAFRPERRLLVGTSVLRGALDGREFLVGVERDLALPWRLLSGQDEGALAFRGGTAAPAAAGCDAPVALVDIGGGSTEFCVGIPGFSPDLVRSVDIGAVRLTERFFHADPPSRAELDEVAAFIAAAIETAVPRAVRVAASRLIGVAATFLTLAAHQLELREYDRERVDGYELPLSAIDQAVALFAQITSAERGRRPGIQKGREDVILAGAMIAAVACRAFGVASATCSEADLLEGAALALADGSLAPDPGS